MRYKPKSPSRGICTTAALKSSVINTWWNRGAPSERRNLSISANSSGASELAIGRPFGGSRRTHIAPATTQKKPPNINASLMAAPLR